MRNRVNQKAGSHQMFSKLIAKSQAIPLTFTLYLEGGNPLVNYEPTVHFVV